MSTSPYAQPQSYYEDRRLKLCKGGTHKIDIQTIDQAPGRDTPVVVTNLVTDNKPIKDIIDQRNQIIITILRANKL
jgi:hypothetical protein